ncbi:sulfite exporter TauE/SafE family protein [Methanosalsum natronophilum]|uniref:sulfite exporter TauE/SafE family protein n=1 Tax=Methanosalsum natronophilum TaxID=768733 RepID=UPI002168F6CC|nr:sulfite exporter TauE/SafE family protein [Methanosalsum natronophilum]MCS3924291.1 putative membrane protein YfcA [Methanosalsum natronophilum]
MENIIFFLIAFLAEIIGTMAGFGSSTILMPFSLIFFDFTTALVLVAFFHMAGNIGRILFLWKSIDRKLVLTFSLPAILFTYIGASAVAHISTHYFEPLLGIFLLTYSVTSLLIPNISMKSTISTHAIGGILSGFIFGIIGTGGAIKSAFLTSFKLEKTKYIATGASIALIIDFIRIPVYIANGYISSDQLIYIPILFFIAIISSFIGTRVIFKISETRFKFFVLVIIGIMGIYFIL